MASPLGYTSRLVQSAVWARQGGEVAMKIENSPLIFITKAMHVPPRKLGKYTEAGGEKGKPHITLTTQ